MTPPTLATRIDALDGVRAFAVGLVVAFHVSVPGVDFGFFGVDVFFVLSGFLITTLLLTEAELHTRIDLRRFWSRRFLRLLPAALLVFAVIAVYTWVWVPDARRAVTTDLTWCLAYLGNWHFISTASYFTHDGSVSPLLHVWSLAVEEQFYVVWPCLVAGLAWWCRRRPQRLAGLVAVLASVVVVASVVVLAWLFAPGAPERAYMGTDAKVWEPLLGAVVAAALLRTGVGERARRWAGPLAVLGIAVVGATLPSLVGRSGIAPWYFRGGAVVGCVGVVLLIVGVVSMPPAHPVARLWGWSPLAYLGRISYGIYLWHWPLAVWAGVYEGDLQPWRTAAVVVGTVALASASYHLVETPLRRSGGVRWKPARVLLTCGVVVGLAVGGAVAARALLPASSSPAATPLGPRDPVDIVVVGDSVPQRMTKELVEQARRRGSTLTNLAVGGCAATGTDSVVFPDLNCATKAALMQKNFIEHHRPRVVLWWSRWELADLHRPGQAPLTPASTEFWAAQRRAFLDTVNRLSAHGALVMVVEPERPGTLISTLFDDAQTPVMATRLRDNPHQVRERWIALSRTIAARDKRLVTTSVEGLICRTSATPCDDRLPLRASEQEHWADPDDRHYARVDGEHFGPEGRTAMASTLVERALAAIR